MAKIIAIQYAKRRLIALDDEGRIWVSTDPFSKHWVWDQIVLPLDLDPEVTPSSDE